MLRQLYQVAVLQLFRAPSCLTFVPVPLFGFSGPGACLGSCCCSYKLGHSEVHSIGQSQAALLTPTSPAGTDTGQHIGNRAQSTSALQPSPELSLQHRVQQLEADMTKVSLTPPPHPPPPPPPNTN